VKEPIPYDELRSVCMAIKCLSDTQARRVLTAALLMVGEYESAIFACEELKRSEEKQDGPT
jgi:hypothetical protein